ncbi:MAG: redoxin domain-containing protein [Lacipirellulaceae bacterium]
MTSQRFRQAFGYWLTLIAISASGCTQGPSSGPASSKGKKRLTGPPAAEVVKKMREVYGAAKSFSCNAETVQYYVVKGEGVEHEVSHEILSMAFRRPNRLRYSYEAMSDAVPDGTQLNLVCDGEIYRAATGYFPNQVFEAEAPEELTPSNLAPEPQLREALESVLPEGENHPQFTMLLGNEPNGESPEETAPFFVGDGKPSRLGREKLDGRDCYRVAYESPAGQRVLWIDAETYFLHRMELPMGNLYDPVAARYPLTASKFWVSYTDQALDVAINESAFEMNVPEEARRVSQFVPPPPVGPPDFLGEQVKDFEFQTFDGKKVTRDTLKGKPTLLDVWFLACPNCKTQTPVLEEVYQELKDEDVAFYAVNTDRASVANETIEKTLKQWGTEMPILRDTTSSAYINLKVRVSPTTLLLDKEGRLQYIRIGAHRTPDELISVIKATLDGEDLAKKEKEEYEQVLKDHEKRLDAVTIGSPDSEESEGTADE